jgi:hypothetical protein
LTDSWFFYDNTNPTSLRLVATGVGEIELDIENNFIWQTIEDLKNEK